jgi:hypothetical protein
VQSDDNRPGFGFIKFPRNVKNIAILGTVDCYRPVQKSSLGFLGASAASDVFLRSSAVSEQQKEDDKRYR